MPARRIVLLRHGRTAWNAERRFQGHADPPLDDVGRAQAWEVGAFIAALRPGLLMSSSAQRAVQTAEIVGSVAALPVLADERFRERGLGHWEGLTIDEVSARYPDEYEQWRAGADIARRGGETRTEVAERMLEGLADLPAVDVTVIVTHGAAALSLANALLGLGQAGHPLGPLANCHWSELAAERGAQGGLEWRLRGHNLGAPGGVVPLPAHVPDSAEGGVTDADA